MDNFSNTIAQVIEIIAPVKTIDIYGPPKAPWKNSERRQKTLQESWEKINYKLINLEIYEKCAILLE